MSNDGTLCNSISGNSGRERRADYKMGTNERGTYWYYNLQISASVSYA